MEEGGYYDGLTTFPFAFFVSLLQRQTYSIDIGWAWGLGLWSTRAAWHGNEILNQVLKSSSSSISLCGFGM